MHAGSFFAIGFNPRAYSLTLLSNIFPDHRSKSAQHRPADRCRSASLVLTVGTYWCGIKRLAAYSQGFHNVTKKIMSLLYNSNIGNSTKGG